MNFIPMTLLLGLIALAEAAAVIFLFVLLVRALLKYLRSGEVRKEKTETRKTLGEALKARRTAWNMTQGVRRRGHRRQPAGRQQMGIRAHPTPPHQTCSPSQSSMAFRQKSFCGKRRGNEGFCKAETLLQICDCRPTFSPASPKEKAAKRKRARRDFDFPPDLLEATRVYLKTPNASSAPFLPIPFSLREKRMGRRSTRHAY